AEAAVAWLLDEQLDARHPGGGFSVRGVRVHGDRARVVELAGGGARGRCHGVLECGCVGGCLGGLGVVGVVVGDGVEGVVAVDGFAVFVGGHGVVEAGGPVGVGVREAEAAVAGLLDVELDARDSAAGGGVGGVRVHRDRTRVVELRAGRAGG